MLCSTAHDIFEHQLHPDLVFETWGLSAFLLSAIASFYCIAEKKQNSFKDRKATLIINKTKRIS